jgi:hypothetical protein
MDPPAVDMRRRLPSDIEIVDVVIGPRPAPTFHETCGKTPRVRAVGVDVGAARTRAGVDMKKIQ